MIMEFKKIINKGLEDICLQGQKVYKQLKHVLCLMLFVVCAGCSKEASDFKKFLNDRELVYPGLPKKVNIFPGNGRVKLTFDPNPDPTVTLYRVFWNNKRDSVDVQMQEGSTSPVSVVVDQLDEYSYSFTVYAFDQEGSRSIPLEIGNIKVYGNSYAQSLTNRFLDTGKPYELQDDDITLFFNEPDTINIATDITYTATDGREVILSIGPEISSVTLAHYLAGSKIFYRSSYIPIRGAIDTFYTSGYDSLANIIVPLDKSLFAEVKLPNDVGIYSSETTLSQLWNGNTTPTDYPNIFHSDSDHPLPHHFTFDLGKLYGGLTQFEIIGRSCCNNPTRFEIWGIDNLQGASTTLASNDSGWKQESQAKGWKLLKEVVRSDDGIQPFKVIFDEDLPPLRYIRIRVINVASGDAYFSNISEISFWRK